MCSSTMNPFEETICRNTAEGRHWKQRLLVSHRPLRVRRKEYIGRIADILAKQYDIRCRKPHKLYGSLYFEVTRIILTCQVKTPSSRLQKWFDDHNLTPEQLVHELNMLLPQYFPTPPYLE